eukprot:UN27175
MKELRIVFDNNAALSQPVRDSKNLYRCNHCMEEFWSKPTHRYGRYLVNHSCEMNGYKRKQLAVERIYPKCSVDHEGPCISALEKRPTEISMLRVNL